MQDLFVYVLLAGMIGLMFFNSRKRKKQQAELQASIVKGANVILNSGIVGTIVAQDGDRLVIETTPGTKLTVVAGAVRGLDSWKSAAPAKSAAPKATATKKPVAKSASTKPAQAKKPASKPAAK